MLESPQPQPAEEAADPEPQPVVEPEPEAPPEPQTERNPWHRCAPRVTMGTGAAMVGVGAAMGSRASAVSPNWYLVDFFKGVRECEGVYPAYPQALAHDAFVFSQFCSSLSAEGFFEEDGELWSADGRMLAQSRQLALATSLGGAR